MDRLDDFRLGSEPEPPGQEPDRGPRAPSGLPRSCSRWPPWPWVSFSSSGLARRLPLSPPPRRRRPADRGAGAPRPGRRTYRPAAARADRSARARVAGQAVVEPDARGVAGHRRPDPVVRGVGRERGGRHVAGQARARAGPAGAVPHTRGGRDHHGRSRSFSRYDGIASAAASLDPAGLARVYSVLKPRLVEAYRELGHPEGDLDGTVERAIVHLLQTPVVEEPIVLRPRVLSFRYDREDLRGAVGGPETAVRMGPRNVQRIQDQLRAVARELGIPAARLRAPESPGVQPES